MFLTGPSRKVTL